MSPRAQGARTGRIRTRALTPGVSRGEGAETATDLLIRRAANRSRWTTRRCSGRASGTREFFWAMWTPFTYLCERGPGDRTDKWPAPGDADAGSAAV